MQAAVDLWHDLPEMFAVGVEGLLGRLADQGINIDRPGPKQFNIPRMY